MKIEQAREVASKALEHLSESLEQGESEVLRNYFAAMGKFHRYSMSNVLLIITQRPDATRVAGYQTWRKLHRQVTRGAKGIVIFAPLVRTVDSNDCGVETEREKFVGYRAAGFLTWPIQQATHSRHCRSSRAIWVNISNA